MSLDTIVRADGEPVTGVDDLIRLLNAERIGRAIAIDVLRRGTLKTFDVRPLERPAAKASDHLRDRVKAAECADTRYLIHRMAAVSLAAFSPRPCAIPAVGFQRQFSWAGIPACGKFRRPFTLSDVPAGTKRLRF